MSKLSSLNRSHAYTTSRSDIVQLVPAAALRILDIGCSNGALGHALKQIVPERRIFGVELDTNFATEAARHIDCVVNADVNSLDWEGRLGEYKFDCIVFADVLEHLVDPVLCLGQAIKKLSPEGSIVISLPNFRHVSVLWSVFFLGQFPMRDRGIFDRTHLRWFTLSDAHNLVTGCGLKVSETSLALRFGDVGGGRLNRWLNNLPLPIKNFWLVREFFTYQICLRAEIRHE